MKWVDKLRGIMFGEGPPEKLFDVTPGYPPLPEPVAAFHARLLKVKDGDTQDYEINKHHGDCSKKTIRLLGVDTREITGKEKADGLLDKEYTSKWLQFGVDTVGDEYAFVVQTVAQDKYGRWLGWVWRTCDNACLNIDLITSGHAEPGPASAQAFLMRDVIESAKGL
jgi:endonuclease YncB( thermonuclease family)